MENEIERLKKELEYAYRCIENGFVRGSFDFTVLRTRASNYLADLERTAEPKAVDRAHLGVDGNCGFALLGENIQDGEAEFEEIETKAPRGTSEWDSEAKLAINRAYTRLKQRLDRPISYYLGPSHPSYC